MGSGDGGVASPDVRRLEVRCDVMCAKHVGCVAWRKMNCAGTVSELSAGG